MKKYSLPILASLFATTLVLLSFLLSHHSVNAYGECDQYGPMAIYDGYSSCQCMSGYVWGTDYTGQRTCISTYQYCQNKYGYESTYDSLNQSCGCMSGYGFGSDYSGNTQCVSLDSICTDRLGYQARYNSLSNRCECRYGYVISGGRCTDGNTLCYEQNGYHSSFNSSDNTCECEAGYTLDKSNQCVEKQNNVYFTLKELDTDNRQAIVRSGYDYRYYLISYNAGCYASSFNRYLNHQIVINLGTDFDLDTWDKIVLQDDDESCDIISREVVDSDTTLYPEEGQQGTYIYEPVSRPSVQANSVQEVPKKIQKPVIKVEKQITTNLKASTSLATSTTQKTKDVNELSLFGKIKRWFENLFD